MSHDLRAVPLADLCESVDYGITTSASVEGNGPQLLRITDIVPPSIDWQRVPRCDIDDRKASRFALREGDIVIARTGATVGYAKRVRNLPGAVVFASYLVRFRVDASHDARYVGYVVESAQFKEWVAREAGGAAQPNASASTLGRYPVPLPPLPAQRRIGGLLSAFDELIAINERRIELLEDLARSLYREWFVRFRFPDHGDAALHDSVHGGVPSGWDIARLGDVATLRYGKALPARSRRPGTVAVVSSAGVIGEHDEALVEAPGIVLGRKGNVGSVWWIDRPFFPIDTTYFVESDLPIGLLYWQLRDMAFIDSHAAVPGLSREQAYGLPVIVPPEALARRFDSTHRACFDSMSGLRSTNAALARARDLLLPRLVTGRLDISDVDLGDLLTEEIAA